MAFPSLLLDDYYDHADATVSSLNFNKDIEIQLKNKLIYKIKLARRKEDHYVKIVALVGEIPSKIVVSKDDGEEKLNNIQSVINAQKDAHSFNRGRASWVYKIDKSSYERIVKDIRSFL